MDFSKLDVSVAAESGFDLQLSHPGTGVALPIFCHVLGSDSDEYKVVEAKQNKIRVSKLWKGGLFRPTAQSTEESDQDTIARLAAVTKSWWEMVPDPEDPKNRDKDTKRLTIELSPGEFVPCSENAAVTVYTKHPWVKEQVHAAVMDRANFFKG